MAIGSARRAPVAQHPVLADAENSSAPVVGHLHQVGETGGVRKVEQSLFGREHAGGREATRWKEEVVRDRRTDNGCLGVRVPLILGPRQPSVGEGTIVTPLH